MSRTYRRKSAPHLNWNKGQEIDRWEEKKYGTQDHDLIRRKQEADFKRDRHQGYYNAPSWYARKLNKKVVYANKAELKRSVRKDEMDNVVMSPCIKNANWNWF